MLQGEGGSHSSALMTCYIIFPLEFKATYHFTDWTSYWLVTFNHIQFNNVITYCIIVNYKLISSFTPHDLVKITWHSRQCRHTNLACSLSLSIAYLCIHTHTHTHTHAHTIYKYQLKEPGSYHHLGSPQHHGSSWRSSLTQSQWMTGSHGWLPTERQGKG